MVTASEGLTIMTLEHLNWYWLCIVIGMAVGGGVTWIVGVRGLRRRIAAWKIGFDEAGGSDQLTGCVKLPARLLKGAAPHLGESAAKYDPSKVEQIDSIASTGPVAGSEQYPSKVEITVGSHRLIPCPGDTVEIDWSSIINESTHARWERLGKETLKRKDMSCRKCGEVVPDTAKHRGHGCWVYCKGCRGLDIEARNKLARESHVRIEPGL